MAEPVILGPRYEVRLWQLQRRHVLTARCGSCRHTRQMRIWEVKQGLPPPTRLAEIEARLVCQRCGNREDNRVLVTMEPR